MDLNPFEEEFTHAGVEDILTAASLAESLKEEIFTVSDSHQQVDEIDVEDNYVDIMTAPEEAGAANAEEAEEGHDAGETLDQSHPSATIFGADPQAILASVPGSVPRQVALESNSTVINSVNPPDNASASTILENISPSEENVDQDDLQSLISFSEAEDTIAGRLDEQTQDAHIHLEQSLNNSLSTSEETQADNEDCWQQNENVPPNDTVRVNEIGDFVVPEIKFFEDAIVEDDLPIQNEQSRLSLDNTFIFSLPTEQALITSPPKRQISLNEENNVNFSIKTFLTFF